jgi:hypothetical protein
VEKVVRGFQQRRSTGAGLFEMPEIARSLFGQRRRSLLLNGSGKVEELFKHDCVPLFDGGATLAAGCRAENYVA